MIFLLRMRFFSRGRPSAGSVLSLPRALIRSFKSAAQLLVGWRWLEEDLSHLALSSSGGDAFVRPCDRLVHIGAFQYSKTADVFLGLKVPVCAQLNLAP
jgi:hypothetical protein